MANEQTKINIGVNVDTTKARTDLQQTEEVATKSAHQIAQETKKTGTNVKKELRELKNAMASMLADGIDPVSEGYQKLAQRAGELEDAMGDAAEEIKAQADDTRNLSRSIGLLSDGINVFQGLQSAMSLFGVESEDATEAIQKMMAAQQLCNTVNELGASITSKSTILGQSYIRLQNALTTATKGQTAAQAALNVTMMAAPWVAAAAAIIAIYVAIKKHNQAAEEQKQAIEETKKEYNSVVTEAEKTRASYVALASQYRTLRTEHEKTQWIEKNKSEFHNLGLAIDNINDADNIFVRNSRAVEQALINRAVAAAKAAAAQQNYANAINGKSVVKGEDIGRGNYTSEQLHELNRKGYIERQRGSRTLTWTASGAEARNSYIQGQAELRLRREITSATIDQAKAQEDLNRATGGRIYTGDTPARTNRSVSSLGGRGNAPEPLRVAPQFSADLLGGKFFEGKAGNMTAFWQQIIEAMKQYREELGKTGVSNKEFVEGMVNSLGGMVSQYADQWGSIIEMIDKGGSTLEITSASLATLGQQLQQIGGDGAIAKAGAVMAAIGQIILGFAQASKIAADTTGPWGWLAFVGAGLGAVATTISTIKGFNGGGIVDGSGNGDTVPAMLTPGEAVFTRSQQRQLFRMANGGGSGAYSVFDINTRIHAGDIIASQRVYNNMYNRIS